ncbi:hypothetical protein Hypma_011281 [Hypsizygus marmoreus]|uniref:Uncharacterized protein n=1 Tax=Hypsizygus marmoreus TaxID=39966 RepID=A0A369JM55_HYPMA|nr:hypothetical protein Hypma_011281 [Hypsizygus marmoreus]
MCPARRSKTPSTINGCKTPPSVDKARHCARLIRFRAIRSPFATAPSLVRSFCGLSNAGVMKQNTVANEASALTHSPLAHWILHHPQSYSHPLDTPPHLRHSEVAARTSVEHTPLPTDGPLHVHPRPSPTAKCPVPHFPPARPSLRFSSNSAAHRGLES